MDNAAFRSLVSSKPSQNGITNTTAKPTSLGSRARSFIPMTPRNIPGHNSSRDFARQVSEHTSSSNEPPLKKFKSSAAPKGAKFGSGYVDRAQLRQREDDGDDDKATRLRNLEEQLKLGQIEQHQFEKLREQMGVGGDVGSTHLVKGLDWKLLERVRRGEDVARGTAGGDEGDGDGETAAEVDVDEELERALERDVLAVAKDEQATGTDEAQQSQQVLSRNEILRRFREQRNAPAAPVAPVLNERFKKVASSEKPGKKKFVESINGRRREVLVITHKDGTTKRKTRWLDPEEVGTAQQPLGMEVPAELAAKQKALLDGQAAEDDNEDIFADAGNDYDPLAGIESESEDEVANTGKQDKQIKDDPETSGIPATRRNYFSTDDKIGVDNNNGDLPISTDPTILAALKRAAQIRQQEAGAGGDTGANDDRQGDQSGAKSSAFLAKLKEEERQDAADLDYGFGESRFGDDDDEDAGPLYDDEEDDKKKAGRKRGPKKRKGNKDNVHDVMSVLEGRNKKA